MDVEDEKAKGKPKAEVEARKQKGVKRRLRNEDIATYGCSAERKQEFWG